MTFFSIILRRLKNFAHFFLAQIAVLYFGYPAKKITIIGVTGTDGKTTTVNFIYQLLTNCKESASLISSTGVYISGKRFEQDFHVTTPSPFVLQRILRDSVRKKIKYSVIEVSSHAINQHRIAGIGFKVGVLTNISKEHLDYHRNMENYLKEKVKLLKKAQIPIINMDDKSYVKISKKLGNKKFYTYSVNKNVSNLHFTSPIFKRAPRLTSFNKSNLLAAVLTLEFLGIDEKKIAENIEKVFLPEGRQEVLGDAPKVVIDFAHTPNAFSSVLPEIKKDTEGKLIHVFGSAGKRDKFKRPEMGLIASNYADIIILTAEDPRSESVKKINEDIKKGISDEFKLNAEAKKILESRKRLYEIFDRKKAIEFALRLAKKADTVLVTGKGHEKSMNLGRGEIPWSDIEVTKDLLKNG